MSSIDLESDQSDEQLTETAAERNAHFFRGETLYPYSFGRRAALGRMLYEGIAPIEFYALVVFICLRTPEELDQVRSPEERKAFREKLYEWADTVGAGFEEAVQATAEQIIAEHEASEFKLKPKQDQVSQEPSDPKASGREAQSSTAPKSRPHSTGRLRRGR